MGHARFFGAFTSGLTAVLVVACGSSDSGTSTSGSSSSSSSSSSSGGSSTSSSSSSGGSTGNAPSTQEQRAAVCDLAVNKCQAYPTVGACIEDQQPVAACFATTVTACVQKLAACGTDDYDSCMIEGAHACDPVSIPTYVTACREKNASCKSSYPAGEEDDYKTTIDDSCFLLPALDDPGRAKGASCVAGPCADLYECLTTLTP